MFLICFLKLTPCLRKHMTTCRSSPGAEPVELSLILYDLFQRDPETAAHDLGSYAFGASQLRNFMVISNPRKQAALAGNALSITALKPL